MNTDKTFFICTTPRTGSSLLCDLLMRSCPELGTIRECFGSWLNGNFGFRENLRSWLDIAESDICACWDKMCAAFSGKTGYFGVKVMFHQVGFLQRLLDIKGLSLNEFNLLRLERRDKLRQAISWYKMKETGYKAFSDIPAAGAKQVDLSFEDLEQTLLDIYNDEYGWKLVFDSYGIKPKTIYYEDFMSQSNQAAVMQEVIDCLSLPCDWSDDRERSLLDTHYRVQSDDWNDLAYDAFTSRVLERGEIDESLLREQSRQR